MAKGTVIKHTRKAGAFVNGELQAGEWGLDVTSGTWYFSRNGTTVETVQSGAGDMTKAEFASQPNKVNTAVNAEQLGGSAGSNYALKSYADTAAANAVAAAIDAAPAALDTLNELAAALGDDPNFATTITNSLAGKAATSHVHNASDINAGDLAVARMQANVADALQASPSKTVSNSSLVIDGGTI